jgi:TolB-like protein
MFLLLAGCAEQPVGPVYTKEGKEYGKVQGAFRGRWWNYFERGLSYGEGGFYKEAFEDFRMAIEQRSEDERMARTYGMHFIDYFPHRELGVVFFRMGNLKAARSELETSIAQFPTAKARFYLDRVRKALIEEEAKDVPPPRLVLDIERDELWTREDPVILSGTAEDERYVAGITISGAPLFLEGAQTKVFLREPLHLTQGTHEVKVEARNLMGKTALQRVIIHVDREGPVIALESVEHLEEGVIISGWVYDDTAVTELIISETPVLGHPGREISFRSTLPRGKREVELVTRDRLGNETSARLDLTPPSRSQAPIRLASTDPRLLLASILKPKDTRPPDIKLKGWTDSQTVFLEKAYIDGQVVDASPIVSLTINGAPIHRRKGTQIFFGHLAELRKGDNQIVIEATDEVGNAAAKRISVTRQIPAALQIQERLSLTVLPFEQSGVASALSLSFQDRLIDSLVNLDRFRVVERKELDLILEEQKRSQTDLIDRSTALRMGKLVAAQSIVTGHIIETKTGTEIIGRLIDTETSEILATQDVYGEDKDFRALSTLAEGLAVKFHRDFPLANGLVIQQKGDAVLTDLGQDKVKLQRRLILYRETPVKHPVTGKVVGADNVIMGRARVTQVMPEMSKADVLDGKAESIKALDKVIAE